MIGGFIVKKLATSILSRWILGGLVALLLGSAALMWHNHKEGLKEEGRLECVQEISQATIDALEDALADEKRARAALRASLIAAATANQEAVARRNESESRLEELQTQMEEQKNEDPEYREWSDTTLPSGVADRLRQAAGSAADSND